MYLPAEYLENHLVCQYINITGSRISVFQFVFVKMSDVWKLKTFGTMVRKDSNRSNHKCPLVFRHNERELYSGKCNICVVLSYDSFVIKQNYM